MRACHAGDVGRWLPDGNIDFIGRIDNQVCFRSCFEGSFTACGSDSLAPLVCCR